MLSFSNELNTVGSDTVFILPWQLLKDQQDKCQTIWDLLESIDPKLKAIYPCSYQQQVISSTTKQILRLNEIALDLEV